MLELQRRVAELLGQEAARLRPDRDDGEPDRAEAARPAGRRPPRRGDLARPRLRVRRRGRPRRAHDHGLAGSRGGRISSEQVRDARRAEHEGRRPARGRRLAREHPQQRGRAGLAARRARGGRRRRRASSGSRCTSTARDSSTPPSALGVAPATIAVAFRHGHALPLEGPRLPARRAARGLAAS